MINIRKLFIGIVVIFIGGCHAFDGQVKAVPLNKGNINALIGAWSQESIYKDETGHSITLDFKKDGQEVILDGAGVCLPNGIGVYLAEIDGRVVPSPDSGNDTYTVTDKENDEERVCILEIKVIDKKNIEVNEIGPSPCGSLRCGFHGIYKRKES
jgi:hypothetical protein